MTQHSTSFQAEQTIPTTSVGVDLLSDDKSAATTRPKKLNIRKLLLAGAATVVVAAAAWYGYDYITVGQYLVSTDDAYVKADSTTVAPKVTGYLQRVLVNDNEPVKAGQVLARIDNRDFNVAFDQAKADVVAAKAAIASFTQFEYQAQDAAGPSSDKPITAPNARGAGGEEDFDSLWKSL